MSEKNDIRSNKINGKKAGQNLATFFELVTCKRGIWDGEREHGDILSHLILSRVCVCVCMRAHTCGCVKA